MYVKCGEVDDARHVFDELSYVDIVLWTTMIVGYTQNGNPLDALQLFLDKKFASIVPNSVTMATVLSASAQLRDLSLGRSIHGIAVKLGVADYDVVVNALVDMYAKCQAVSEANSIFGRILNKDVVTWNSMIAGYAENNMGNDALMLFKQMRLQGASPDATSVVNALSASVCLGDLLIGKSFHNYAVKHAFLSNVYVNTALLNLYSKCADLPSARRVFNEMNDRNSVTWCAMIGGYGMQGDSASSIDLFNEMLKDGVHPNDVAFTSILSTCSHTGMVTAGKKYFDSMAQHFNITPSMKHYACMVDVLARAGNLEQALEFIDKMPMQADVSVWGAFLHGCGLHSRLQFGEEAIKRMMVLHPERPDLYVLISNLYTSYGMWEKSLAIRRWMQEKGLVKLPGCSSIGLFPPLAWLRTNLVLKKDLVSGEEVERLLKSVRWYWLFLLAGSAVVLVAPMLAPKARPAAAPSLPAGFDFPVTCIAFIAATLLLQEYFARVLDRRSAAAEPARRRHLAARVRGRRIGDAEWPSGLGFTWAERTIKT
ncbi:Pentatricopeptide repeat-containing protein [Dichanthelium oligosanthes]|uniref:Pentatricopeptide repeat-containing protein n=1 Tax=Dichanthelium oligosanthes TaxID=888268 RepID=A0A1E5V3M9_9POAL|nr:Pentatricopeptide repeat-containing protein [Dichanthelium oligosanthes]